MEDYLSPQVSKKLLTAAPSPGVSRENLSNGLSWSPTKNWNGTDNMQLVNDLTLPPRYVPMSMGSPKKKHSKETIPMDSESREKDLEMAIKWLRKEMIIMKRQNQVLLRRFLDLRTAVVNYRSRSPFGHSRTWSIHSSDSDVSSLDDSTANSHDERRNGRLNSNEFLDTEFRARTTSMLTPRNSLVLTLKPRSKESF